MNTSHIQAIILAAGASTRFNTGSSKLIVPLCGQELILYPVKALHSLNISQTVVVGHYKEQVIEACQKAEAQNIQFVDQKQQRGTGDALLSTRATWNKDHLLVINGDMPLITAEIIKKLCDIHLQHNCAMTFITAHYAEPGGYGRVIKEEDNPIKIVENRDFTGDVAIDCCINAGIYIFNRAFLEESINNLTIHENSSEFYITDLVEIAHKNKKQVKTVQVSFDSIRGVNTLKELWECEQIKRACLMSYWMEQGVRFPMAHKVHIEVDVEIGAGSTIESGVQLLKGTKIGKNCVIEPYSIIDNAIIEDNVCVKSHSIIKDSTIKKQSCVGPFTYIHNKSILAEHSLIGSFIEMSENKHTCTKEKKMTYLGDTVA